MGVGDPEGPNEGGAEHKNKPVTPQDTASLGPDEEESDSPGRSRRPKRPFPIHAFEVALTIAQGIQDHGGGQRIRRLTLLQQMELKPDSSKTRERIASAAQYGLIKGSYKAEHLELTDEGKRAVGEGVSPKGSAAARMACAIDRVAPFKALFERFTSQRLPVAAALADAAVEAGVPRDYAAQCADLFRTNAQYLGLIKVVAGSERLVGMEHALEGVQDAVQDAPRSARISNGTSTQEAAASSPSAVRGTCLFIAPIGDEGSIERRHSDLYLEHLVKPALAPLELDVIRADQIAESGLITTQVVRRILDARLVIADLSFINPNVFYELGIAHTKNKPVVHIIRKGDRLPFDVAGFRTIIVDEETPYSFVPKMETYIAEIRSMSQAAISDPGSVVSTVSEVART